MAWPVDFGTNLAPYTVQIRNRRLDKPIKRSNCHASDHERPQTVFAYLFAAAQPTAHHDTSTVLAQCWLAVFGTPLLIVDTFA
jgi:hypothetical protein